MIIPNLCCSIRIEPGSMHCVSVVVPHPSYLPEKSWKRMVNSEGMVVSDIHTINLMRTYGYNLNWRGDVIMSVDINCDEKDLREHMLTLTSIFAPETKETKETEKTEETEETKETKVEEMLESLDISEVID